MELNNEFRVAVPAAKTWQVLTDVERVAPCIPGAQLLSVDGDDFTGAVKVKVGPITVSYKGDASFQEKDEAAQRVVIKASGKETRGSGNAAALVTAQLKDEGDATHVVITTDLTISGKAAQFGRGVLADVSDEPDRPVRQEPRGRSARRLRAVGCGTSSAAAATPAAAASDAGDSVDLLKVVAVPMAKRYAPAIAAVAAGVVVGFLLGRRKRAHPAADLADELQAALARLLAHESRRIRLPPPRHRRRGGADARRVRRRRQDPRRRPEPGADARHAADVLREPDRHLPGRRTEEHRACATTSSWVAAGTPHALVGMDDEVAESVPLLTLSTPYIGHFQIRTRGTLGGAIAHADPAAEYAAVALALDATMEATSSRGTPGDTGGRILHRPVGDVVGSRRDPHRRAVPGVGRAVRLRGRGIRQAPRRFRDRGCDGRGGTRRRRPGGAVRHRTARSWFDAVARPAAEDAVVGRPPTPSPQRRSAGSR